MQAQLWVKPTVTLSYIMTMNINKKHNNNKWWKGRRSTTVKQASGLCCLFVWVCRLVLDLMHNRRCERKFVLVCGFFFGGD